MTAIVTQLDTALTDISSRDLSQSRRTVCLSTTLTLARRTGLACSGINISQPVSVVPNSVALATRSGAAHIIWHATIAAAEHSNP